MKCNQEKCTEEAAFLYTWPGDVEKGACVIHKEQLTGIAKAMDFQLHFKPIRKEERAGQKMEHIILTRIQLSDYLAEAFRLGGYSNKEEALSQLTVLEKTVREVCRMDWTELLRIIIISVENELQAFKDFEPLLKRVAAAIEELKED